jgi:hypothetical protein
MTFGAEIWGPPLAQAGISAISGILGGRGQKETRNQKLSRNTAKDLIASLKGEGPYSNLFSTSEADFQKGFVQPALSRFQNQIAPQIQQQFIASGQQRGTGLDDTLTRAGVDLNQSINENFLQFQQGGQNRAMNALSGALNLGSGAPSQLSPLQAGGQALSGYLASPGFADQFQQGYKGLFGEGQGQGFNPPKPGEFYRGNTSQPPKGFSRDFGT